MSTRHEPIEFIYDLILLHFCFVLAKDREFLQEVKYDVEEVGVIPLHHHDEQPYYASVHHLFLYLQIFGQVHQQVESNKEHLFLLFYHY